MADKLEGFHVVSDDADALAEQLKDARSRLTFHFARIASKALRSDVLVISVSEDGTLRIAGTAHRDEPHIVTQVIKSYLVTFLQGICSTDASDPLEEILKNVECEVVQ